MDPITARTPAELPPGRRLENFVWAASWLRGFSLRTDLDKWGDACQLRPAPHRSMVVSTSAADINGVWHLICTGRRKSCSSDPNTAHGLRLDETRDPTLVSRAQQCATARAAWPGYLGPGATSRQMRLQVAAIAGTVCGICQSMPARTIDHDHLSGLVRGYLCICCNNFVDRCRHLDSCAFADYLNHPPLTPAGIVYTEHAKRVRDVNNRSRAIAFQIVMVGGVSPGVGDTYGRREVDPLPDDLGPPLQRDGPGWGTRGPNGCE